VSGWLVRRGLDKPVTPVIMNCCWQQLHDHRGHRCLASTPT